ncbi:hypothetical protein BH10PAT1_BH10PAT1_1280 [soil metagenome]
MGNERVITSHQKEMADKVIADQLSLLNLLRLSAGETGWAQTLGRLWSSNLILALGGSDIDYLGKIAIQKILPLMQEVKSLGLSESFIDGMIEEAESRGLNKEE